MRKIFFISLFLFVLVSQNSYTQENNDSSFNFTIKESELLDFEFTGKPRVEASYGFSQPKLKSLSQNFSQSGLLELRLGYATQRNSAYRDDVFRFRDKYVFLSNTNSDFRTSSSVLTNIDAESWKFGFGRTSGWGNRLGSGGIMPYVSNGFVWSRIDVKNNIPVPLSVQEQERINDFDNALRFGTYTETGIRLQLYPMLTLRTAYQREIVFPRYLFWKHLGSYGVEAMGMEIIYGFVREIMKSSPAAGPLMNVILKGGYSYALYQLRAEKMNWPFTSSAPLVYDSFKFGMTFTF
ncbi:MAG: hypothetical protein KGZ58_03200 [Ignavibacteriales bacterium]|nr:hypothetical protein [Ignavibacteriales bacterium]